MTSAPVRMSYRALFAAVLFAGASYWLAADPAVVSRPALIAWKGSAVALLAIWAALNARDVDGWSFAAVMALGAVGDILLESSQTAGALAFLAGHAMAATLYLRHRRANPAPSQFVLAVLLLITTPVAAFLLPADRAAAPGITLYALFLGVMAGSAWASRFPRYRVGIGAALFVASDLLIFARLGPLAGSSLPHLLIWPLYLIGQAMIALGVITTLVKWKNDDDLHHRL